MAQVLRKVLIRPGNYLERAILKLKAMTRDPRQSYLIQGAEMTATQLADYQWFQQITDKNQVVNVVAESCAQATKLLPEVSNININGMMVSIGAADSSDLNIFSKFVTRRCFKGWGVVEIDPVACSITEMRYNLKMLGVNWQLVRQFFNGLYWEKDRFDKTKDKKRYRSGTRRPRYHTASNPKDSYISNAEFTVPNTLPGNCSISFRLNIESRGGIVQRSCFVLSSDFFRRLIFQVDSAGWGAFALAFDLRRGMCP